MRVLLFAHCERNRRRLLDSETFNYRNMFVDFVLNHFKNLPKL